MGGGASCSAVREETHATDRDHRLGTGAARQVLHRAGGSNVRAGAGAREKGAKVGSTAGKLHAQKENLCPDLLPTCLNSTQMLPMGPKRRPSARTSAASVSGGKRPPRRRREAIVKVSLRKIDQSFCGLAFRVHPKYHGAAVTKIPRKSSRAYAHTPRPKLRGRYAILGD